MKRSSVVLWGLVAVLTIIAVAMSCADSESTSCVPEECVQRCQNGTPPHAGGECRNEQCFCTDPPPTDADAEEDDGSAGDRGGRDDRARDPEDGE